MNLAEIRKQYPMYSDVSDGDLARAFHSKFYSDMDFGDFSRQIGYRAGYAKSPGAHDSATTERAMAADPATFDPSYRYGAQSRSTLDNLRAGVGKGLTDLVRGAGQMFGAVSRQDVADARERDSDLMGTTAGKIGNVAGTIAGAAPSAFIPGANTYLGATGIGAGLGLLQPSTSTKETLTNVGIGGVLSPAAMLAGRGAVAGVRGAKSALIDPFTKAGQERIAQRTFQSFAGGADDAAKAAANIRSGMANTLPGSQPTVAELAQNAGLSNLERVLKNQPDLTQAFANRAAGNRNAMLTAIDSIAGDDAARAAAVAAREAVAKPLYAAADVATVQADDALNALLRRPSMESAWKQAAKIAAESGEEIAPDALSGRTLHFLKTAMDDLSDWSPGSAVGKSEARAIGNTRDQLVSWMDNNLPSYGAAREAFKAGSKPINQMDIGSALRDRLTPALTDFGAQTRLRPESFAAAMRSGDDTAARVLGRSQASISEILTPDQMATLNKIGQQLARRVNADELGKAVGSNTGQNLVGQDVLRRFLGPLGVSQQGMERASQGPLLQGILGAPSTLLGKATETVGQPSILKKLAEIGLSPEEALKILEAQIQQQAVPNMQWMLPAVSGANAASQ